MKVGILSDIHENLHNLRLVLNKILELEVKELIFLGDYMNPGLCKEFFKFCNENKIKLNAIFGNNDGDRARIFKFANEFNVNHSEYDFAEWNIDNKNVFVSHFNTIGLNINKEKFDAIFFGHNHEYYLDESDKNHLVANPGEISSHITGLCSFIVWDTKLNSLELIKLERDIYNPNI